MEMENGTIVPVTIPELKMEDIYKDAFRLKHVLKWSYLRPSRISEPEMIKAAKRVLERYDNNPDPSGKMLTVKISKTLPEVLNGYDIDEKEKNFRAFLGVGYEEQRGIRFAMLEYLEPIHSLSDLTQFKDSIRHIALAINYLSSSEERIKHRDINTNNLMFRRLSGNQIQGVLCDWDQSSRYETEKSNDHPGTRNGTRAFISFDLHKDPPPVHIERFDYESLFYVMFWMSMNYSRGKFLDEKEKHSTTKKWSSWNIEDDWDIADKKYRLLSEILCDHLEFFTPFFQPLVISWLDPLRTLLNRGYYLRSEYLESVSRARYSGVGCTTIAETNLNPPPETELSRFNNLTLGGQVCFEKIWSILET